MRPTPSFQTAWHDLRALLACLDAPAARLLDEHDRQTLRATLTRATHATRAPGDLIVAEGCLAGRVLAHRSVVLYRPDAEAPLSHRVLEIDAGGTVTAVFNRDPRGELREMWLTLAGGEAVGMLPGGAHHPLWGPSDRLVRAGPGGAPATLTLAGAVTWSAIGLIPPIAELARLPSGAGAALLNALAALAWDQGQPTLRYRGPYPTEQLFWSLTESFRVAPSGPGVDPLARFLTNAEETFARGALDDVPVDWIPAPHERRVHADGLVVQLRDSVERIVWDGRSYHRIEDQGLRRREHRIVRAIEGESGARRHVASLTVLGQVVEDHLVLDDDGQVLDRNPPAPDPPGETPLAPVWREALAALLPLEATPLLTGAIEAVWPEIRLAWGPVPGDLVDARGTILRLSPKLASVYRSTWAAAAPGMRRGLAQRFVREVLGLIGPALRNAAVTWLEALPSARQEAELEAAAGRDRVMLATAALAPLGHLLDALEAGEAPLPEGLRRQ
jgi:hypothetical protein